MESIGFTYRIPRYYTDRQNYIEFTYKSPINLLYLFTVYICRIPKTLNIFQISAPLRLIIIHEPIDVLWSPLFALNEILEVNPRKRVQSSKLCHVSWQLRLPNYAVQYWRSVWLTTAWTVTF